MTAAFGGASGKWCCAAVTPACCGKAGVMQRRQKSTGQKRRGWPSRPRPQMLPRIMPRRRAGRTERCDTQAMRGPWTSKSRDRRRGGHAWRGTSRRHGLKALTARPPAMRADGPSSVPLLHLILAPLARSPRARLHSAQHRKGKACSPAQHAGPVLRSLAPCTPASLCGQHHR